MAGFNLIPVQGGGLPDFLKELGGYQDEGLGAGIAPKAPKLAVTIDKHFTITKEGQTVMLQDVLKNAQGQDVAVPAQMVRCIIVAAAANLTKAWYETGYEAGKTDAPDCFSNDGKVPAPGVAKPQCSNCAACPKNAFGSNPVTGRGKACSDRKIIVVVWEGDPDTLMTFNVPTMSLNSLQKLDSELRNANIPMQSVLVGLTFDQSVQYPVVKIQALGFVDKETTLKWKEASGTNEVSMLLREADYEQPQQAPGGSPVPNNQIAFGQTTGGQGNDANSQANAGAQTTVQDASVQNGVGQTTAPAEGGAAAQAAVATHKRTRRTKAEMEAARAAAAAGGTQQTTTVDVDLAQVRQQEADIAAEQQAEEARRQQHTNTAPVTEDDEEAALMAQLEAARARKAALAQANNPMNAQTSNPVQDAVAQQQQQQQQTQQVQEPIVQSQPQTGNVMDLLAKWKS